MFLHSRFPTLDDRRETLHDQPDSVIDIKSVLQKVKSPTKPVISIV